MILNIRKMMDSNDIDMLQRDLSSLGELVLENKMNVNAVKSKAVGFTNARVKARIRYYFGDELISDLSSLKYLVIIIRINLTGADHVNYKLRKAWEALYFIMRTF